MGGVFFALKYSFYSLNKIPNASITIVAFNKIYSNTLFVTNARVDVAQILNHISMITLYFSVNVWR